MALNADDELCRERVAIVTGGTRGIGREVARALVSRGYAVVVNYAGDQAVATATVDELVAARGTAFAVRGDVADELDVQRLFAETAEAFGGVDVVVHAAGRMILGPVEGYDLGALDALLRTNARGTFVVNQQAAHQLRDGGAIVNVSCSAVGRALPGFAAYAASKGAVEAITAVLARELRARGIAVNAVAPSVERPSSLVEIASVVAFLVSRGGQGITGQVIRPDSGPARAEMA